MIEERIEMNTEIYLDNSATTKLFEEVADYVHYINKNIYGNPSSLHSKGLESEKLIKKSRDAIAKTLKVNSKEIYFTSGGTESNNLAIKGYLEANKRSGNHIITSKIEHPSVLEVFKFMERNGYEVNYLNVNKDGFICLDELKNLINDSTSLISLSYINNEIGAIQPISEVVAIKNKVSKNIVLHVDAVQAYGKYNIFPKTEGINLMSISSHKIHGPKGCGALYVDNDKKVNSLILGGQQESTLRSGTENISGICGFGLAAENMHKNIEENFSNADTLKQLFVTKLKKNFNNIKFNSPKESTPYVLNVSFENLRGEVLLHFLETKNIFVSTGSACSSKKTSQSHVLKALGLEKKWIEGAIRFSFSQFNSEEDIHLTIKALSEIVPKIRVK